MRAYTIVAIAPEEIQQKFNTIKKRLDLLKNEPKDLEEHIILKYTAAFALKRTFYLKPEINEEELKKTLTDLSFSPINIICTKSGLFPKSNYGAVVYVEVEKSPRLVSLHLEIKKIIDNIVETKNPEYEDFGWTPHMTVLYNLSEDRVKEVQEAVNNNLLPLEFSSDKLYLLGEYNDERDEREIVKVFNAS